MKQLKKLFSLLLVFSMLAGIAVPAAAASVAGGATMEQLSATLTDGTQMAYWLYTPANAAENMPLITFLHGGNGRNKTTEELVGEGYENLPYYLYSGQVSVDAYVLIPHITGTTSWDFNDVSELTKQIISAKSIDSEKVSLTGHSLGGKAVWTFAYKDKGNIFNRYAPLSGSPDTDADHVSVYQALSVRTAYGTDDSDAGAAGATSALYDAIMEANPSADITCTVLEGYAHADVVRLYLNKTDVSGNAAATYSASGSAEYLMDWLSYADVTSEEEEDAGSGSETTHTKGIEISGKTEYTVGDTLDLTVTYYKSSTAEGEDVTPNTVFTGYDMSKAGTYTVQASVTRGGTEYTATYTITVVEKEAAEEKTLTGITVDSSNATKSFEVGDTFTHEGIVVTATYSDGSTEIVTDYTVSTPAMSPAGEQTVTVTYGDASATYTITVTEKETESTDPSEPSEDEDDTSDSTPYQYVSIATFGNAYILVSNGYALQNNNGTLKAVAITVSDDGLTVTVPADVDVSSLLWTMEENGDICNGNYFLTREKKSLALVTAEPDYKWYYANDYLGLMEGEVTYYAMCNKNSDGAFQVTTNVTRNAILKLYGNSKESGAVTKTLVGISVDTTNAPTEFVAGSTFYYDGLKVTATYSDGTTEEVTGYTVTDPDMTAAGAKTVAVSYWGMTATYSITVTEAAVDESLRAPVSIMLNTTDATKKEYQQDVAFDTTGMSVTITFDDGTTETVEAAEFAAKGIVLTGTDTATSGTKQVIASYTENGTTVTSNAFEIVVISTKTLSHIEVTRTPYDTEYFTGDTFTSAGLEVTAYYTDGTTAVLAADAYTLSEPKMNTSGTKTVTVTYEEDDVSAEASFQINVLKVGSIMVTKVPDQYIYAVGEKIDYTGLEITAQYSDGSYQVITDYTLSDVSTDEAGNKIVTVSYTAGGTTVTSSFKIVVTEEETDGEDDDTPEENDDLHLFKSAVLNDDGTYTITLEAFATGKIITNLGPVDICLILDTSGSMYQGFVPNYRETGKIATMGVMYDKATTEDFLYYHHNTEQNVYRQVKWSAQEVDGVMQYTWTCECGATCTKPYSEMSDPTLYIVDTPDTPTKDDDGNRADKMIALINSVNGFISGLKTANAGRNEDQQIGLSIATYGGSSVGILQALTYIDTDDEAAAIQKDVSDLECGGNTPTDKGFAQAVQALNSSARKKVYILFTDGLPTGSKGSGFSPYAAQAAIQAALVEKETGATIYSIAVVSEGDPDDTEKNYINMFMNGMSTNYPHATSYDELGNGGNFGYYMVPPNVEGLEELFETVENTFTQTSVTLDETSILYDIMAKGFKFVANQTAVSAASYAATGINGETYTFSDEVKKTYTANKTDSYGLVSVTGYDYSSEYVYVDSDGNAHGTKLVVTITGVEATDAVIGTGVNTNYAESGVYYSDNTLAKAFPMPHTTIGEALYVLDYAKTTQLALDNFLQQYTMDSVIHLDTDGMNYFGEAVTVLEEVYGDAAISNGNLTYTPDAMNWDGYDTFYVFGQSDDPVVTGQEANANKNVWSKISVLPANNVYYEDTFVTEDEDGGRVGIVYIGTWTTNDPEHNDAATPETDSSGDNHGWITVLDGELTDTDGTATGATAENSNAATATFTFTGSGVDIYSRTSPKSGTIFVMLNGTTDEGETVSVGKIIDTVSYSGEYYQVPTCSFNSADGLSHGTYQVTVRVTAAASSEGRYTYYLDGIRVYNPLSHDQEDADTTIQNAYGDEIHSYFEEIRDKLIDQASETLTGGAVFIDMVDDGLGVASAVVGTYEDFGPKNEVYLQSGQMIVMNVTFIEGVKYYVGMKLLNGGDAESVTAGIMQTDESKASLVIDHSADMYYEVTPVPDGKGNYTITIQNMNTDTALLSITKLKVTNVPGATAEPMAFLMDISTDDALAVATLAYAAPVVDSEVPVEPEEDVTEPTEPKTEPSEPETPDVEIDNPGTDEEAKDHIQNIFEEQTKQLKELVKKLFGGFSKWFGR